jgi:hypothetical protein
VDYRAILARLVAIDGMDLGTWSRSIQISSHFCGSRIWSDNHLFRRNRSEGGGAKFDLWTSSVEPLTPRVIFPKSHLSTIMSGDHGPEHGFTSYAARSRWRVVQWPRFGFESDRTRMTRNDHQSKITLDKWFHAVRD